MAREVGERGVCTWVHVCACVCLCVCKYTYGCVGGHMHVDRDSDREMEQNPGPRHTLHAVMVDSVNLILQEHSEDKALVMSAC